MKYWLAINPLWRAAIAGAAFGAFLFWLLLLCL